VASVTYVALAIEVVAVWDASAKPSTTLQEKLSQGPESPRAMRAAWQVLVSRVSCVHVPGLVLNPVGTVVPFAALWEVRERVSAPELDELAPELPPDPELEVAFETEPHAVPRVETALRSAMAQLGVFMGGRSPSPLGAAE
jgi:hypothetical protein